MHGEDKLSGILILDKPVGLSSMRAIVRVRRAAGGVRTGHAGTLDPLASGVLVVALGRATKSIDRFMDTEKRYRTTIDLSAFTTTDDREGERTEVAVDAPPSRDAVERAISEFVGVIQQRPPVYSAMKVGGRRAYAMARKGQAPELAPRPVTVHAIALLGYRWPMLSIDIRCAKGVYVRSLARDIGARLGTGGHCHDLRRTAVGPFDESDAMTLDALPQHVDASHLVPLDVALDRVNAANG